MGDIWNDFSICGLCRQVGNFCIIVVILIFLCGRVCVVFTGNDVILY